MSKQKKSTDKTFIPLLGIMLSHFTNDFYANFVPVFIPKLHEKFDLSFTQVGILSATYTAAGSFLQLLFGFISDRVSRWRFVWIGPMITGFFMSFIGVLPSYPAVLAALVLAALGTAMFHPQGTSIAGRILKSKKGLLVSLFIASGTLGFSLGPILMALFIDGFSLESSPFALIPLFLLGLITFRLQRDLVLEVETRSVEASQNKFSIIAMSKKWQPLFVLWGLVTFRHAIFMAYLAFFLILMDQRGIEFISASVYLTAVLLAGVVGGMLGGWASDHWGRWRVSVTAIWLGVLFTIGFLLDPGPIGFISLLIGKAFLNASNPSIVAHAQELHPKNSSTASAIVMGVGWGAGGLLVGPIGVLSDAVSIEYALWIASWVAFGAIVLLTLWGRFGLQLHKIDD
jgi:FSR family fosmidomycin resistance protein-like MFS transporter